MQLDPRQLYDTRIALTSMLKSKREGPELATAELMRAIIGAIIGHVELDRFSTVQEKVPIITW